MCIRHHGNGWHEGTRHEPIYILLSRELLARPGNARPDNLVLSCTVHTTTCRYPPGNRHCELGLPGGFVLAWSANNLRDLSIGVRQ